MNSSCGEEHDTDLLQAQIHAWNRRFKFINSFSLKCAVELGIPDLLEHHPQPISISKLLSALSIHPSKSLSFSRLLRLLTHHGFFNKQEIGDEECYTLTDQSSHLLQNNTLPSINLLDPRFGQAWNDLSGWFLNKDPKITSAFEFIHGKTVFECAGNEKALSNVFNEAMENDSRLISGALLNGECKEVFDGLRSLVDVGGGTGTMAKAIVKARPDVECTVLDLPHVVGGLEGSQNLKYVAGDMFEAIPHADAIFLKWIFHNWSDEKSLKILEKCKEAIRGRKEGKLIIIDMVIKEKAESEGDDEFIETQLFLDVHMMVMLGGQERTEKEWAKLFFDAGFSGYNIKHKLGLRSLIEVYP